MRRAVQQLKRTKKTEKKSTTVAARTIHAALPYCAVRPVLLSLSLTSRRMMPKRTKSMMVTARETRKARSARKLAKTKPKRSEQSETSSDKKARPQAIGWRMSAFVSASTVVLVQVWSRMVRAAEVRL